MPLVYDDDNEQEHMSIIQSMREACGQIGKGLKDLQKQILGKP